MITIEINKEKATTEELEYFNNLPGFDNKSLFHILNNGRQNGISVLIKDIKGAGAVTHTQNTENGIQSVVVASTRTGMSFLRR